MSASRGGPGVLQRVLRSRVFLVVATLVVWEGLMLGGRAAYYAVFQHPQLPDVAARNAQPLEPLHVDPAWILEGTPTFSSRVYATSPDGKTFTGIWECTGPTRFRWHFDIDETVYLLEGLVNIEYRGEIHTLRPGDTAFFPAGAQAVWHVPERIRKSFTLHEPGRLNRLLRVILD